MAEPATRTEQLANPFRPGNGVAPPYLAGRDQLLAEFERFLGEAHPPHPNWTLTGIRGTGKTVLLGEFASRGERAGWVCLERELGDRHRDEERLVEAIQADCDALIRRCDALAGVGQAVEEVELARTLEPFAAVDGDDLAVDVAGEVAEQDDQAAGLGDAAQPQQCLVHGTRCRRLVGAVGGTVPGGVCGQLAQQVDEGRLASFGAQLDMGLFVEEQGAEAVAAVQQGMALGADWAAGGARLAGAYSQGGGLGSLPPGRACQEGRAAADKALYSAKQAGRNQVRDSAA